MGALDFVNRIRAQFFGGDHNPEGDLKKQIAKYERIVEDERRRKDGKEDVCDGHSVIANVINYFSPDARRAFRFSNAYGECYDQCASQALRDALNVASLGSLIPKNIAPVASQDALTFKRNAGEAALTDLVSEVLGEDMSEGPKPNAEFLIRQKLNDDIRRDVRVNELQCEVKCAKKFLHLVV